MLKNIIVLSPESQDLIKKLTESHFLISFFSSPEISLEQFLQWFAETENMSKQNILDKKQKVLLAELRSELLKDLCLVNSILNDSIDDKRSPFHKKIQFVFLVVTGTIVAFYDGFRDIISLLGIFSVVPPLALLGIGIAFSILSAIVFYGFNLAAISTNLGINFKNSPLLIDSFLKQVEQIDHLTRFISKELSHKKKLKELEELKAVAEMLKMRYLALCEEGKKLDAALNTTFLTVFKHIITGLTGILFFTGGFFSGQSISMAIALGFFGAAVAPICWPVLVISIVFGLGALCGYIWMERPGVEKLVSQLVHLDKDKIEILTNENITSEQNETIDNVTGQIREQIALHRERQNLHLATCNMQVNPRLGLFKKSASLNDLQNIRFEEPPLQRVL